MPDLENSGLKSKAEAAAKRRDPPKKKSSSGGPDVSSLGSGGSDSSSAGPVDSQAELATPSTFKRGGKVRKTGRARVHKGERVLTAKQNRKYMRGKR
jgi:hypothetical protein